MLPIGGLIRRLDAHHMRPSLALELQRLALGCIEVRNLADFDGDRHAGGRQTVHLIVLDDFGQRQSELACAVIAQEVAHGAFRSYIEADALQGLHGYAVTSHSRYASNKCSSKCNCKNRSFSEQHDWPPTHRMVPGAIGS